MDSLTSHQLSPDSQAVLLLCGSLGAARAAPPQPLTPNEYNHVASWLHARGLRPGDLLQPGGLGYVRDGQDGLDADRLGALLDRGAALALTVERWTNAGLWVLTRGDDPDYPPRLRSRLKQQAPPVLYGAGDCALLDRGGLVIVGSRDADEAALAFARRLARRCAAEHTPVISGGARGIDLEAMRAALDESGLVVGVLADSLRRAAVSKAFREAVRAGRLVLCSPYDPAAGFSVGNAMGRNKLLYALGDAALVVSSTAETGGTWAGATENLKRRWVPLSVRAGDGVPEGNRRLIRLGARELSDDLLADDKPLLARMTERDGSADSEKPKVGTGAVATQLALPPPGL